MQKSFRLYIIIFVSLAYNYTKFNMLAWCTIQKYSVLSVQMVMSNNKSMSFQWPR